MMQGLIYTIRKNKNKSNNKNKDRINKTLKEFILSEMLLSFIYN